jgi:hypothetical protein
VSTASNRPIYLPGTTVLPNMAHHPALRKDNITFRGSNPSMMFLIGGAIAIILAIGTGMMQKSMPAAHILAAIHIGATTCLAICLGSLIFLQVNLLTNAGWYAVIRRQIENIASLTPIFGVIAIATPLVDYFVLHGKLFTWMDSDFLDNPILFKKAIFFNPVFYFGRGFLYIIIWAYLSRTFLGNSLKEDQTADRWLTAKSRRMAAWGLILTAL